MPVALSIALAGALAWGAYAGSVVLCIAVAFTQGLLIAGWYRAVPAPGVVGGVALSATAAGCADLLLLREGRPLGQVTGVLGLTMVGVLAHQLIRNPRDRVTVSMTATAALAVIAVLASMYVAALRDRADADLVAVVAGAVAAARLPDLLPVAVRPRGVLAVAAAAVAGLAVGAGTEVDAGAGVLLGVVSGAVVAAGTAFAARLPHPHLATSGALPVALAGPVAVVLGRIVLG